jgi:hypothetical protein
MLCGAETLQQHGEESDSRWEGGGRHGSGGDEEEDGATASVVSGSGARPE